MDWQLLLALGLGTLGMYLVGLLGLLVAGRRAQVESFARFVPDCAVLFGRLARERRVSWRYKVMLLGVAAYLAMPIDLVPDFIPVAGQLDDAIIVALALRAVVRGVGADVVAQHWGGSPGSLAVIERLAGAR